jgi:hypothetical protein
MGIILYIVLEQLRDNLFGLMALLRNPGPPVYQKTYFRLTNSAGVDQETAILAALARVQSAFNLGLTVRSANRGWRDYDDGRS